MKVSGFSIIRNGIKLGYPYLEAIRSILPICDEFIIVVGKSEDATRESIAALDEPKIKIIDTIWDEKLRTGGKILAQQTDIALDAITGDWGFYIQGDEVVHEKYLPGIQESMLRFLHQPQVEGLLFGYKHFYGSYDWVGASMRWYRNEIRVIRNDKNIRSYRDAQGFRKNGKKLQVKKIAAEMYHYGWCRPPGEQALKQQDFNKLYHDDAWVSTHVVQAEVYDYATFDKLEKFTGSHPMVLQSRIKAHNYQFAYDPTLVKIKLKDRIRYWVEKYTGHRLWEYRNYKLI